MESETASIANDVLDDPLQELTTDQLIKLIQETLFNPETYRANEVLLAETQMFEKFLKRVEEKEAGGSSAMAGAGASLQSQDMRALKKSTKSRSYAGGSIRLSAEQKCDIAQRELEELRVELDILKEESDKILDAYKAIMEEADIRLAEMKKEAYEFDRDIVKGAVNQRTHKVIAEKVIRHFEDRLRARDTLVEKLRLKNSTLKVQKKKLVLQLKQKEEMGEVLHEVDFNQLKIENQQYLEKIDERNKDLLRLKLLAGSTLQVLNTYKSRLHILTMESDRLRSEIASRNDLLTKIAAETITVEAEREKAERINRKLRDQLTDYSVPQVMEYVMEKADVYDLQKKVKSWERKVEIAEMALMTHKKTWSLLQAGSQMAQQWQSISS